MQVVDALLCLGPATLEGPLFPMAVAGPAQSAADPDPSTASDVQSTVAIVSSPGAPLDSDGTNGMWAFGGDGHVYFKTAGAWVLKI